MKLSNFIAQILAKQGVDAVFGVTGGAVVHLFDSAVSQGIKAVFTHHEQAAAFAAQAYARIKGFGAAFFTTGPGGTNAVTGISAAWLDSIPVIYIGGQVRSSHIKPREIRQQGAQELDVISIVSPIVKYAVTLMDPFRVKFELEKCLYLAKSGRPGPVYLEIPLDLQWADIGDPGALASFQPESREEIVPEKEIEALLEQLFKAKRPLLLLGHGIRLGRGEKQLEQFLQKTQIPYVTTWNASDLVNGEDPLYLGRPGMFGGRMANLAVQMSDFLCCLGSHLPTPVTTSNYAYFAKKAEVAVVNIDPSEIKNQRIPVKYPVHCDVVHFLERGLSVFGHRAFPIDSWRNKCVELNRELQESIQERAEIDAYWALTKLNECFQPQDIVVVDGGGTIVQMAFQTLNMKKGQRLLIDAGLCSMGSGLPQAVGAAFARKLGRTFCLCGDGSFQFNVHELQTIFHHNLPVKLFIFNNNGYLSIRHTQGEFLGQRFIGSSPEGGISVPDILAVAAAYKIPCFRASKADQLEGQIEQTLASQGPALCEIMISSTQEIRPKIGFDEVEKGKFVPRPMEDMHPYLPRQRLAEILNFEKQGT